MIDGSEGRDPADGAPRRPAVSAEEAALAARLDRLGETLGAKRAAEEAAKAKGKSSGFAQATKIASEFVAGVIVGGGLGWAVDRALGTAPFGLIILLLLGFAAGVLNVLRAEGVVADAGARLREKGNSGSRPASPGDDHGPRA